MRQSSWMVAPILVPFSRPFPKIDFWMHFGRPLAHFWLPFCSVWLPFGSLWAPTGSLLVPFGSLSLNLGSIFSLWEYPGVVFDPFPIFSAKNKIDNKSCFLFLFSKFSIFYAPASARHQQTNRRSPFTEGVFSLHSFLSHLGPERNLAVGNLDPLRARRRPRRVCVSPWVPYQYVTF